MKKYHLIIDLDKCLDCNNCFLSCKDEFIDNDWPGYSAAQPKHGHRWMNILRKERGQFPKVDVAYLPVPCMHCENAPCISKGRQGAVYRRDDGIVIIDPGKAFGQKGIVESCPYGAIWWNEERNIPQKCTWCAHLLDAGWKTPRCVQACPTGALRFVRVLDSEMDAIIQEEMIEVLYPKYKTKPSVYYRNLYRYFKCFIAGSVTFKTDGLINCAELAKIVLTKDGNEIREAVTDNYGDFKFDHLEENSGMHRLEITFRNREKKTVEIDLRESINVGTILFS
jgi:Fe-S-cluster-containing dehydrogenase component